MKVKIVGSELVDADINFVSLVKRGANRSPFKIIKAEDISEEDTSTLKDRVSSMFGSKHETPGSVVAVFVQKDHEGEVKPLLAKHGFAVDDAEIADDVIMYKQEGATEGVGTLIALNDFVGIGIDRVVKEFQPWARSDSFTENANSTAFFPGLCSAMESLKDTIHQNLYSADVKKDAKAKIKSSLASFSKYVIGMFSEVPESVFKLEKDLHGKFEIGNVDKPVAKTEGEKPMSGEQKISEAVAGDLDGLNTDPVSKQVVEGETTVAKEDMPEDEKAKKMGGKKMKKMRTKKGEDLVEVDYYYDTDADGNEIFLGFAEDAAQKTETPAVDPVSIANPPNVDTDALVAQMTASLTKQLEPVVAHLEKVEKVAVEAAEKAGLTVLVKEERPVDAVIEKKEPSIWAGAMSNLPGEG